MTPDIYAHVLSSLDTSALDAKVLADLHARVDELLERRILLGLLAAVPTQAQKKELLAHLENEDTKKIEEVVRVHGKNIKEIVENEVNTVKESLENILGESIADIEPLPAPPAQP